MDFFLFSLLNLHIIAIIISLFVITLHHQIWFMKNLLFYFIDYIHIFLICQKNTNRVQQKLLMTIRKAQIKC